jgi:hypothetical protein
MKESIQELLDEYTECVRALASAESTGEPADEAAAAVRVAAEELRSLWTAQGEDPAELDKLLHQTQYRERVISLYSGKAVAAAAVPESERYHQAREAQKVLTVELREFWLASGHDLADLRKFESAVDAQVIDMLIT